MATRSATDVLSGSCLVCGTALRGPLGALARLAGVRPSSGNPNLCNRCDGHLEEGRIVELAVFFADLKDSTRLTQELGPDGMHQLLDSFLKRAEEVIVARHGFVTQFVGDEVMAFFNAPLRRDDFQALAVGAGADLQRSMAALSDELGHAVQARVGIAAGHARVGHVGSKEIAHYGAIGDVVSRAARLVARVSPGGVLIDGSLFDAVAHDHPGADIEHVDLKGFDEPVRVALLDGRVEAEEGPASTEGPARTAGVVTTIAAVLGAPCAGYLALNSLAVALGFGSFTMGAAAMFLDQSLIRLPLMGLALVGALVILVGATRSGGGADRSGAAAPTRSERRRNRMTVGLATATVLAVAAEVVAHRVMH